MRSLVLVILLAFSPGRLYAQQEVPPEQRPEQTRRERLRALREKAWELIQATQALGDWEEHYGYMLDAVERVFERNGWNSESDLFSLEVVREVGAIPPWNVQQRYERFLEMIGDRYLLDEEQMASLRRRLIRANIELFSRHADRIMQYLPEVIETRAAGEPFTPEQIARWTKLAEPVFQDVRGRLNALAADFIEELDPEQRELVERDMAAANRRMRDLERIAQRWKRGQWAPRDWGLEDDPIQNPGGRPLDGSGRNGATSRPAAGDAERLAESDAEAEQSGSAEKSVRPGPDATDDDPWARYVRAFIGKYHLNDEQQQRAWLIYRDATQRRALFEQRYRRELELLRGRVAAADNEQTRATLRQREDRWEDEQQRLFKLLKRRLERLPTRAQRREAEPGELEPPLLQRGGSATADSQD